MERAESRRPIRTRPGRPRVAVTAVAIVESEVRSSSAVAFSIPRSSRVQSSGRSRRWWPNYEDRAVTSPLPPLVDGGLVGVRVFDAVAGFGLLQPLLEDGGIEEVWING